MDASRNGMCAIYLFYFSFSVSLRFPSVRLFHISDLAECGILATGNTQQKLMMKAAKKKKTEIKTKSKVYHGKCITVSYIRFEMCAN